MSPFLVNFKGLIKTIACEQIREKFNIGPKVFFLITLIWTISYKVDRESTRFENSQKITNIVSFGLKKLYDESLNSLKTSSKIYSFLFMLDKYLKRYFVRKTAKIQGKNQKLAEKFRSKLTIQKEKSQNTSETV